MNELPSKLRRAARRLRLATLFVGALVELVILFSAWVTLNGNAASFPSLDIETAGLPPFPGMISLLLLALLVGLALLRAIALLRAVEAGNPFPARALRGFAFWLFLTVLFGVLGAPLLQLLTHAQRITISLSNTQALMLLLTGLLFFVARLLAEAERLADEHSQIV